MLDDVFVKKVFFTHISWWFFFNNKKKKEKKVVFLDVETKAFERKKKRFLSVTNGMKKTHNHAIIVFSKCTKNSMVKNVMEVKENFCFLLTRCLLVAFILFFSLHEKRIQLKLRSVSFHNPLKLLNDLVNEGERDREGSEWLKHQSRSSIWPDRLQWSQNFLLLHEF